jgi:uncharacterized membrane protein YgcG
MDHQDQVIKRVRMDHQIAEVQVHQDLTGANGSSDHLVPVDLQDHLVEVVQGSSGSAGSSGAKRSSGSSGSAGSSGLTGANALFWIKWKCRIIR